MKLDQIDDGPPPAIQKVLEFFETEGWLSSTWREELPKEDDLPPAPPASGYAITRAGIELVKHFEGLHALKSDGMVHAYKDPIGIWTIGYGHTGIIHRDGTVYPGRKITQAQAEELLRIDIAKCAKDIDRYVKVDLKPHEFDALVSFKFNLGPGNLSRSTLLKKLNRGDKRGAADEILRWNRAGGRVFSGLVRRRKSERHLFLTGQFKPYV